MTGSDELLDGWTSKKKGCVNNNGNVYYVYEDDYISLYVDWLLLLDDTSNPDSSGTGYWGWYPITHIEHDRLFGSQYMRGAYDSSVSAMEAAHSWLAKTKESCGFFYTFERAFEAIDRNSPSDKNVVSFWVSMYPDEDAIKKAIDDPATVIRQIKEMLWKNRY